MIQDGVLRFKFQGEGGVYDIVAQGRDGQVRLACTCPAARRQQFSGCSHRIELLMGMSDKVIEGDPAALARLIHGTELEKSRDAWLALDHAKDVATANARKAKDHLFFVMDFDPNERADRVDQSKIEIKTDKGVVTGTATVKMWGVKPDKD